MSAIEVVLIRHAESEANVAGRWQGQGDAALSAHGLIQAEKLRARLTGARFDRIVASDLGRAAATARALAGLDREIELDPLWREMDLGAWEGLTRAEVAERFPDQLEAMRLGLPVRIGGGETYPALCERVERALARVLETTPPTARRIAVVTHGGVITSLVGLLLGARVRRGRAFGPVANTSMTVLRQDEGGALHLSLYNDAAHIGPLGDWAATRLAEGIGVVALIAAASTGAAGLSSWCGRLDAVYTEDGRDVDGIAAAVGCAAARAFPAKDLAAMISHAVASHPGARVGVVASATAIHALGTSAIETARGPDAPEARARLGEARAGAVAHVLWREGRAVLADYNVAPHLKS